MTEEERKVREGKIERIKALSKQLIVDWVAAAVNSLHAKLDLVHKLFIVTGINTILNDVDDHMVRSDTYTEYIFDDDEFLRGSPLKISLWPQKILREYLICHNVINNWMLQIN